MGMYSCHATFMPHVFSCHATFMPHVSSCHYRFFYANSCHFNKKTFFHAKLSIVSCEFMPFFGNFMPLSATCFKNSCLSCHFYLGASCFHVFFLEISFVTSLSVSISTT